MRLVLVSTVIFAISSVQSSVLHGFKHFLLPALAPVVYPLGVIARRPLAGSPLGCSRAGRRRGAGRRAAPGDQDSGPDPLRVSVAAAPRPAQPGRAPGGAADGAARARPGGVPPDAAGDHQPGLAPGRGQGQRAGMGLGCHAIAGDDHRHGLRAGRLPDPGRPGRAPGSGRAASHAGRVRCARCLPWRCLRRRSDPARPAAVGIALPARGVRRACDGDGVCRAALFCAGTCLARLPGAGRARLLRRPGHDHAAAPGVPRLRPSTSGWAFF